jgi:hypothetical protein
LEINLKQELEEFGIELQTKIITDQTTEIIKASRERDTIAYLPWGIQDLKQQ